VGATVNLDNYEKDNPRDFTLLKRVRLSELKRGIFMRTRWGSVRPSLHLQCTAMAMHYLGECFDVHVGGRELIFPHHENMTAIAQALTGSPLAQYWVHAEQVRVGDVGDRPEAGAVTLSDLRRLGFEGRAVRYWLLSRHHHKPLLLSTVALVNSRKAVARLEACVDMLADVSDLRPHGDEIEQLLYDLQSGFTTAMDDDLNTPAALGVIFKAVRRINHLRHRNEIGRESAQRLLDQFHRINSVLQVLDRPPQSDLSQEVTDLMRRRHRARQAQNWPLADRLRDQLNALGVETRDQKVESP
jgi:cysteinyl-tRNA synthetase